MQTNMEEQEDEVTCYVKTKNIRVKDDPLIWWLNNRDNFPTLTQLARNIFQFP